MIELECADHGNLGDFSIDSAWVDFESCMSIKLRYAIQILMVITVTYSRPSGFEVDNTELINKS